MLLYPSLKKPSCLGDRMKFSRIWLMLTDRCNLNCKFCYQENKGKDDIKLKTLIDAIGFIQKNSTENVEIMLWGGEPLLRFDLIKEVVEKYPHLNLRLATNGKLLTEDIVDFFYKYRDTLGVCLSVPTGETGTNIYRIYDLPKFFIHIIPIEVDKILKTVQIMYNKGARTFQISLAHKTNYTKNDFATYETQLKHVLRLYRSSFYDEDRLNILNWDDMLRLYFTKKPKMLNFCGAGCSAISISPKGDIYPCDWFYDLKRYKLGDIYNGLTSARDLFLYINKNRKKLFKDCHGCKIERECGSHMCLAENLYTHGSIYKPVNTTCRSTKLERRLVIEEGIKEPQLKMNTWGDM